MHVESIIDDPLSRKVTKHWGNFCWHLINRANKEKLDKEYLRDKILHNEYNAEILAGKLYFNSEEDAIIFKLRWS